MKVKAALLQSQILFHGGAEEKNMPASPLVANMPKMMIYSTRISEGKGMWPLSCPAVPTSGQAEWAWQK